MSLQLSDEEKSVIEKQFDWYCKKILREEKINIKKKEDREKENAQKLILQLKCCLEDYVNNSIVRDKFPSDFHQFYINNYLIEIKNEQLAHALKTLSGKKRNIIFLAYFLDMTDREIANSLKLSRSSVQNQRQKSLDAIKQKMEKRNGKK